MSHDSNLPRFLAAQKRDYAIALSEIKKGRKTSHWMWYIFPQIHGLGFSESAKFYAIQNIQEAEEFLNDPVLGKRLIEISNELLKVKTKDARQIFDIPDDMKLHSSITLFASLKNTDPVFQKLLDQFFNGKKDEKTLQILAEEK